MNERLPFCVHVLPSHVGAPSKATENEGTRPKLNNNKNKKSLLCVCFIVRLCWSYLFISFICRFRLQRTFTRHSAASGLLLFNANHFLPQEQERALWWSTGLGLEKCYCLLLRCFQATVEMFLPCCSGECHWNISADISRLFMLHSRK